jgi:hypothetical protein
MIYLCDWLQENGFQLRTALNGWDMYDCGHVRVLIEDTDVTVCVFEPGRARIPDWEARFRGAPAQPVIIPTIQLALDTVRAAMLPQD